MKQHQFDRWFSLIETLALIVFLTFILGWRIFLVFNCPVDSDELFTLGGAYRVHQGVLPYLNYLEVHPPLLFQVLAPLFNFINERGNFLDLFRLIFLVIVLGFHLSAFFLVRKAFSGKTALWAIALLNTFIFFVHYSVTIRHDMPGLLVFCCSLLLLIKSREPNLSWWRMAVAALGIGLAISLHLTIAFPGAAVCLWLALRPGTRSSRWAALGSAAVFGLIVLAGYVSTYLLMFGWKTPGALRSHLALFTFDRLYQSAGHFSTLDILVQNLIDNPLPWFIVIAAAVILNTRWIITRRTGGPLTVLFILLLDAGIFFLILPKPHFSQHYFYLALFGSILAAILIQEYAPLVAEPPTVVAETAGAVAGTPALRKKMRLAGGLIVLGLSVFLNINSYLKNERAVIRYEEMLSTSSTHLQETDGYVGPVVARIWLARRAAFYQPFRQQLKSQTEAALRFILDHSRPGDPVYTDWLNPPFRMLPGNFHHGYLGYLMYSSKALHNIPELVRTYRRFDPTYVADDLNQEQAVIRLFRITRPSLIMLDGSMARLYVTGKEFYRWILDHYQLVLEPVSQKIFAILKADEKLN